MSVSFAKSFSLHHLTGEFIHLLPICKQDGVDPLCTEEESETQRGKEGHVDVVPAPAMCQECNIHQFSKSSSHCTHVDTEAQRGAVTCPKSHSKELPEAECKPRSF